MDCLHSEVAVSNVCRPWYLTRVRWELGKGGVDLPDGIRGREGVVWGPTEHSIDIH